MDRLPVGKIRLFLDELHGTLTCGGLYGSHVNAWLQLRNGSVALSSTYDTTRCIEDGNGSIAIARSYHLIVNDDGTIRSVDILHTCGNVGADVAVETDVVQNQSLAVLRYQVDGDVYLFACIFA